MTRFFATDSGENWSKTGNIFRPMDGVFPAFELKPGDERELQVTVYPPSIEHTETREYRIRGREIPWEIVCLLLEASGWTPKTYGRAVTFSKGQGTKPIVIMKPTNDPKANYRKEFAEVATIGSGGATITYETEEVRSWGTPGPGFFGRVTYPSSQGVVRRVFEFDSDSPSRPSVDDVHSMKIPTDKEIRKMNRNEIELMMRTAMAALVRLEATPDPAEFPVGSVLKWTTVFNQFREDERTYMYVALKTAHDTWYTTAEQTHMKLLTDDLLREAFLGNGRGQVTEVFSCSFTKIMGEGVEPKPMPSLKEILADPHTAEPIVEAAEKVAEGAPVIGIAENQPTRGRPVRDIPQA